MLGLYKKVNLPYAGLIPPIVADYLAKDSFLASQVQGWFEPKLFEDLIKSRNFLPAQREKLVQTITQNYAELNLLNNKRAKQQLEILALENTFTITTGHQLSLFGGTYFMAFKILTAIKLSRELKLRHPEHNFVPLLWLASEDHDFEEIKSTWWNDKNLSWELDSKERATGQLSVQSLQLVVEELVKSLENMGGLGVTLKDWINQAYLGNHTLANASIKFYHSLFAEEGLLILDANSASLKVALKPIMVTDLFSDAFYSVQANSDRRLSERYKLQIKPRNGNFFYLHETHGRKMLKKQKKGFQLADTETTFTDEEIKLLIENHPERFSPNVNLRPLYQELILPNLAYIGGPAEIAYWLQLKPLFNQSEVRFPALTLRFMAAVPPNEMQTKLEKFNLPLEAVLGSEKEVTDRYLKFKHPFNYEKEVEETLAHYQAIIEGVKDSNPILAKQFLNLKLAAKKEFEGHQSAYKKTILNAEEESIQKLLKIRSRLYPNGTLQERIETYLSLRLKFGLNLNQELLNLIEPFSPGFYLLKTEIQTST